MALIHCMTKTLIFPGKCLGIRISSITRAITKRYSTPSQLVGKAGITFKRRADTRDTQRIRWQRHFFQVFLGKSTHAQTVITRPLTEGCGLEARLMHDHYICRHLNCHAKCVILTHLEVLSRSHALLADSHAILDRRSELINIH